MQIEQLRSQVSELRGKMDEFTSSPHWSEKGRHTMEEAKHTAMGVGQRMSEQKGMAIPLGTLLFALLAFFVAMTFYPEFGTRMTETFRKWWNEYFGEKYSA
jgi:hypothetical protein